MMARAAGGGQGCSGGDSLLIPDLLWRTRRSSERAREWILRTHFGFLRTRLSFRCAIGGLLWPPFSFAWARGRFLRRRFRRCGHGDGFCGRTFGFCGHTGLRVRRIVRPCAHAESFCAHTLSPCGHGKRRVGGGRRTFGLRANGFAREGDAFGQSGNHQGRGR